MGAMPLAFLNISNPAHAALHRSPSRATRRHERAHQRFSPSVSFGILFGEELGLACHLISDQPTPGCHPSTHAERREILINVLPVSTREHVDLVHHRQARMGLDRAVEPVPARAVRRSVGEGLEVSHGSPVRERDDGVGGFVVRG